MKWCWFAVLCVVFLPTSQALSETACTGKFSVLSCTTGYLIQIDSVLYGRTQNNVCNPTNNNYQNVNCRSTQTSTNSVKLNCQSRTTCLIMADPGLLGEDPCPQHNDKYLTVQYHCVGSKNGQPTLPTLPPQTTVAPNTQAPPQTTAAPNTQAPPKTTTTASTTTPTTTTNNVLPTGVLPIGVGGLPAGGPNNSVRKGNTSNIYCHENLVSGKRGIPDAQMSASSQLSLSNNPHRARLHTKIDQYPNGFTMEGGWTADPSDQKPYIELKMNWLAIIQGITTQGRHVNPSTGCCHEWTTHFKVSYSLDGTNWKYVQDSSGQDKVFIGNTDEDTTINNMFDCPITARFVRVEVVKFVGSASMRLELIGCPTNDNDLGICPKGWKERPGSDTCYYISAANDTKSWENAMITCKRNQGEIVKIDSLQEKSWLRGELSVLQQSQKLSDWWVGLNNRPRFDNLDYKWTDGAKLDPLILQWKLGQPNNAGSGEHCAAYFLSQDNLDDLDCNKNLPFICEAPKYWVKPINIPASVKPPMITTIAPPTVLPNKVPAPAGVTAVTSAVNTFSRGCLTQSDCAGRAFDFYQSCLGCSYYVECAPNGVFPIRCPLNLKFDSNRRACVHSSSTCTGP